MIEVNALKTQLTITEKEQITSGSVNVYKIHFHFSSHWDNLDKIAVFRTSSTIINVPIENDVCVVPWEVTVTPGDVIRLGVYGIKTSEVILPTIWTNLATVVEGVFIGDAESGEHTADVYDLILAKLNNIEERIRELQDDIPTDNEIYMIVKRYLTDNPIVIDQEMIWNVVENYLQSHPIDSITREEVQEIIKAYLADNPIDSITREEVQEMIDQTVGSAISDGY